jgi:DNA-binding NtrC family response regulator
MSAEPAAIDLHEQVAQFRTEAAGRCRADRLVGESPEMRLARAQIEVALQSRRSVLLVGPPGSGRQHVAAAIHYGTDPQFPVSEASLSLSSGSLVPLSCSLLGAELIRSTLVALTNVDAAGDQPGPRTLLLNDADEVPAAVQSELAAVLAGRSFPLRLIATAGRGLMDLARIGQYSAELAGVLSTITIELPGLAERRRDVPLLAQLFLEEANAQGGRQLGGFTAEALDLLDAYPWPGNVDELVLTVAQAHRQAEGPLIGADDLPERIHLAVDAATYPARAEETIVLDEFLARVETELIERALARAKGNKAQAARLLGMTRPRLYRRLVQLGLEETGDD